MKAQTNESITKYTANLDEIVNNVDEIDVLLNSKKFLTGMIYDLLNNKRNIVEWKLYSGNGSVEDVDSYSLRDTFGVEYEFHFKYKFEDKIVPLSLYISGEVPVNKEEVRNGDYFTPTEGGSVSIDYKNLGDNLDLGLFDQDGSEINIKWLPEKFKTRVAKEILQDYI